MSHLRYTIRLLLRSPGFAIACVVILGFGIGLNTAIFSLINAVILKPLPYPNPERLVRVSQPYQNDLSMGFDYPDFVDTVATQHSFESLAVADQEALDLSANGQPEHLEVEFVSPSMFKVSGLPTVVGRVFTEQEDIPNGPFLAVLSEHFWRARFQSDPKIIGKNLTLSGHSFQVIGVVPTQVCDWGPPTADIYTPANTLAPLGFLPNGSAYPLANRDVHRFFCAGRLKAGISVAEARADLEVIQKNLLARYPDTNKGYELLAIPMLDSMVGNYTATIWLLGAAVSCLLLISCANVANLHFARGLQLRREMIIRAALGATRWRLTGQLLLETICLSIFGGILGLLIALGSTATMKWLSPPDSFRFQELSVDLSALVFVFGAVLLTALVSGLLPAWSLSRVSLVPALKDEGDRAGTRGPQTQRTQSALVCAQVALACVLLIGAGLLVHSFQAAQNVPLGFNPHHLLTIRINLSSQKYETDGVQTRAFWDALITKIRRLPGVTEAAMSDLPPLKFDSELLKPFTVDGQPELDPGRQPNLVWQQISSDLFRTMQVPILQGRDVNSQDTVDKQSVVIIDDSLAQCYFPNQSPLGKGITLHDSEGNRDCTIIGVVPHLRYKSPGQAENTFQAYFPYSQWDYDGEFLILRSEIDPAALVPAVREAVASIDPGVPIYDVNTYDDVIAQKFVTRKLSMLLVSLFSVAALFLSAIGLYGILAYAVGQRTREIGIRVALGAQPGNILRLITAQGLKIVGIGLIVGLLASLILVRFNAVDVVGDWDKWRGRDSHFLFCLGRLKNGVTLAQAQSDLETIQRNLAARYPEDKGYGVRLEGDQYATMKDYSATLWLLFGAAGALLLISITNVATLLMARASDRQREMTVRAAMGASRLRLIGHLLRESTLLSLIGGLLGIPVALMGIQLIKWLGPEDMPRVFDVSVNPEALFMFLVVSLFAAVASGLVPALLLSKTHPESVLRAGSRGATAGPQHRRMQSIMMICQVSIACVLLVGTGLLVRSFQAAVSIPLGFDPRHLLTAEIYLVNKKYRDQWAADNFFDAFLDNVRQVPGVTAAAASDNPPFSREQSNNTPFTIPGQPAPETGHEPRLEDQLVSSNYFKTLQTPLVAGRDFNETDKRSKDQRFINAVVIVNQALADTFFQGQSPLGRQIELPGSWMAEKTYTIVGVVQNMRHGVPDHHFSKFEAYFPYCQHLTHFETLLVRSSSDPMALLPALRQAIASIDPDIPLVKVIGFDDVLAKRFATRRLAAMLVSIFSVTALLLAAVGLYGVLAYAVTRQTQEIGIRIAVGALRRNILVLIFKQGFKIVGIGIVAGLLAASALNGFLGNLLYGVGWTDPITITLSVAALCFAALIACLLPALRAARINPIAALRE